MLESSYLVLPIEIIRERHGKILAWSARFVQYHDAFGMGVRNRAQENGINDAKDCGVGANAESERQHRNESECWLLCQQPQGVTKFLEDGMHDNYSLRNATIGSTTLARR